MIKIDVDYTSLYSKLIQKRDQAPNKLSEVVNESGFNAQELLMYAAPIRTGNLRGSHRVENKGLLERIIFPDTAIAPYALYVIMGHRTKKFTKTSGQQKWVKANNYPARTMPIIKQVVNENLQEFTDWLNE